jgi:signal transduction histidine kinase
MALLAKFYDVLSQIDPTGTKISGRAQCLMQALLNLVGNAIKFRSRTRARCLSLRRPGTVILTVSVTDTGPGIPQEELKRRRFTINAKMAMQQGFEAFSSVVPTPNSFRRFVMAS